MKCIYCGADVRIGGTCEYCGSYAEPAFYKDYSREESPNHNAGYIAGSVKYMVKKGESLWSIAKRFYGSGSEWRLVYEKNKTIIEKTARKYGRKDSVKGNFIYPGTILHL